MATFQEENTSQDSEINSISQESGINTSHHVIKSVSRAIFTICKFHLNRNKFSLTVFVSCDRMNVRLGNIFDVLNSNICVRGQTCFLQVGIVYEVTFYFFSTSVLFLDIKSSVIS